MNSKQGLIKKYMNKCFLIIEEVLSDGVETDARTKLDRAIYELEAARAVILSLMAEHDEKQIDNELSNILSESASGTIEIIGNNWLHLSMQMLLPSDKNLSEMKKLSNTVTNLLDCQAGYLGYLPQYERAFVAIVEHKNTENVSSSGTVTVYDHDNKGYRAIPNAMKGRVFADDNQFTMSLGLFTKHAESDLHCDIYVIPIEDITEFSAQYLIF